MERACTTGIAAANEVLKVYGRPLFALRTPQKGDALARGISGAVYGGRKVLGAPITLLARSLKRRKR
jgi:hypothetical protein